MKASLFNALLLMASLVGYLEWGKSNKSFLFGAEAEVLSKALTDPLSVIHPLTILPMLGQVLLLITLFQHKPGRMMTTIAIGSISLLFLLIFAIGCMSLNFKILFSSVPFLTLAFFTLKYHWKKAG